MLLNPPLETAIEMSQYQIGDTILRTPIYPPNHQTLNLISGVGWDVGGSEASSLNPDLREPVGSSSSLESSIVAYGSSN